MYSTDPRKNDFPSYGIITQCRLYIIKKRKHISYSSGAVYEGDYQDDKKHGKGRCTLPSGAVYEGDWQDDKRHGKGRVTYSSGDVYEGVWQDDKKHGKGRYTTAAGEVKEKEYKNGVLQ